MCSLKIFCHTRRVHKKSKNKYNRRYEDNRSVTEDESEENIPKQMNNNFNEKLRNKIFEITKEIKEANRKIILKEATFISNQKRNNEGEGGGKRELNKNVTTNRVTKSESNMENRNEDSLKESAQNLKKISNNMLSKKKSPAAPKRHVSVQKYKLRSKSLPQGVRRKFGFGSFVEIVDRPKHNNLLKIKSRTSVTSGSKTNLERGRPKTRTLSGPSSRQRDRSTSVKLALDKTESSKNMTCLGDGDTYTVVSNMEHRSNKSFSNFSTDFGSNQIKLCATYLPEDKDKLDSGKKSIVLSRRQPIPFTICRTSKTFNLGLNIQQVLSMIKSKRHSTMLQAILKDNIQTARSVIQKTEPINALYIATSSRIGRTTESETCPARDDDQCFSVISANSTEGSLKCKLLTCRQSVREEIIENIRTGDTPYPLVRQIKISELQRPEDVWVVEQPDSHHSLQRIRSRCTCYPSRDSVDYQKVLKQYSRMKQCEQKAVYSPENFVSRDFATGFVMAGSDLYSMPSHVHYREKIGGPRLDFKRLQEDLDNLTRRYEFIQEQIMERRMSDYEVDAELDALELEFNYREEDCKTILNFHNQLLTLKRKLQELRGRPRSSSNMGEVATKQPRSRKDPFRPTPSMTLTKVLRQIQCLQNKIKLIDSHSIT
ncbi:UNVERIFIED_CONTAM: hypothetical protein PYX00_006751 [Menopon gallinae]|uniref:Uncharacterized protein n=1 Tax=Menopon gallinae TaxID=328185 RepID=A0AAW2HW80_9NEOP